MSHLMNNVRTSLPHHGRLEKRVVDDETTTTAATVTDEEEARRTADPRNPIWSGYFKMKLDELVERARREGITK